VRTLLQSISLFDDLIMRRADGPSTLEVSGFNGEVPDDESNLAFKALRILEERCGRELRTHIAIHKRIPPGGGLAGGSADAAAVIKGANEIHNLGMTQGDLLECCSRIGSDVAFTLHGGLAAARGKGDILTPFPPVFTFPVVIVKPPFSISTAWAYAEWDRLGLTSRGGVEKVIEALKQQDVRLLCTAMMNDLEQAVVPSHPEIAGIKKALVEAGCLGAMMTGSGSCVFGIAPEGEDGRAVCERAKSRVEGSMYLAYAREEYP
jgi:4-diphosphocytidyl-2-C-methyl-D-erythritol kinase